MHLICSHHPWWVGIQCFESAFKERWPFSKLNSIATETWNMKDTKVMSKYWQMKADIYGEFFQTWEHAHSLQICHFTGRNHHFKMESHDNYKAASSVAHQRDISFRGFKSTGIPPAPRQLPAHTGIPECLETGEKEELGKSAFLREKHLVSSSVIS